MSLMIQPEPRIIRDPRPNSASRYKSGKCPACAASPILHVHGQNKRYVPRKCKNINSMKYINHHMIYL